MNNDTATLESVLAAHKEMKVAESQMNTAAKAKITPKDALSRLEQSIKESEEQGSSERLATILGAYQEIIVTRTETYNEYDKAREYFLAKKEAFDEVIKEANQGELPFEGDKS